MSNTPLSKSKEEILRNADFIFNGYTSGKVPEDEKLFRPDDVKKVMDKYAKQKAIEFAKHLNKGEDDRFADRYEYFLKGNCIGI